MKTECRKLKVSKSSPVKIPILRMCIGLVICALMLAAPVFAGNIDSPAAPSNDSGRMYTTKQIYDVASGDETTWPAKPSGGFNEPAAGPASTMNTLDDIQGVIAAGVTTAVVGDILTGKTAITRGAGTGETLTTGTMPDKEGDNASTAQAAAGGVNYLTAPTGFYDGGDRVSATDAEVAALDTDITAGNIKDTVEIFGVTGTYTGGGGSTGLPKTGQETQYTAGDDADYADPTEEDIGYTRGEGSWAGWNADGGRFTDNGDGTITDNATGLMWAKDGDGAGCNSGATIAWAAAITWAEGLTFAGYSDWRLPNVKELMSIVDYGTAGPSVDTTYFPNTKSNKYWSSTTYAGLTLFAWYVDFNSGLVLFDLKTNTSYVRAVRAGQ